MEEKSNDHRDIGKRLNLFHIQEEAPGMVFWHPKGWTVYQLIESYMREKQKQNGYQEIKTPQIVNNDLWKRSGHAAIFGKNMFSLSIEEREYAIKPMNCPCHIQVFNQGIKSYKDLPYRLSEFGSCHRYEPSGSLHGLMRVRGFTQDDAHIFCTYEQIQSEVSSFIDFLHMIYNDFGFKEVVYRISTRPEVRVGTDADWDKAEESLKNALNNKSLPWEELPGEGAFYGPKIEFSLKDNIGRVWQCGTIQVDFSLPGKLDAQYVDSDGSKKNPVMLHRAVLGSFERFIGVLLEHYEGSLPLWLSPVQVVIANITDDQKEYALSIQKQLKDLGIRVEVDDRNEKMGLKIRENSMQRIPFIVVVGKKEVETGNLSVRTRRDVNLGEISVKKFTDLLLWEIQNKL